MSFLDSLKNMFSKADETRQQAQDMLEKADGITDMIPGDKDDKMVDNIKEQVDGLSEKFDQVSQNIPGMGDKKSDN